MENSKMNKKLTTVFIDVFVALVVASGVVLGAPPPDPNPGIPLDYHTCVDGQHCRQVPECPAANCNSCTSYTYHKVCELSPENFICIPHAPAEGGCGVIRTGTCGANDTCTFILTRTPCDREDCSTT